MKHELSIIPAPDPRLVPRYLLEQVKDRNWSVEQWYENQISLIGVDSNILLVIIDKQHFIKGFVSLTLDNFDGCLFINTFSVDAEFQRKSKLIKFIKRYITDLAKGLGLERILWSARRHKALEKYGFQESEYKLMEYRL